MGEERKGGQGDHSPQWEKQTSSSEQQDGRVSYMGQLGWAGGDFMVEERMTFSTIWLGVGRGREHAEVSKALQEALQGNTR